MPFNTNSKAVPFLTTSFPFNLVPNKHNSWDEDLMGGGKRNVSQQIAEAYKTCQKLRYISPTRSVINK